MCKHFTNNNNRPWISENLGFISYVTKYRIDRPAESRRKENRNFLQCLKAESKTLALFTRRPNVSVVSSSQRFKDISLNRHFPKCSKWFDKKLPNLKKGKVLHRNKGCSHLYAAGVNTVTGVGGVYSFFKTKRGLNTASEV